MKMTRDDKVRLVQAYWNAHRGLKRATEGAREIAEQHGLKLNSVRGIQNTIYKDAPVRPWDDEPAPTGPPKVATYPHSCPSCDKVAQNDQEVEREFGWRKQSRGRGPVKVIKYIPQSYCRACKNDHKRKQRAAKRAREQEEKACVQSSQCS